MLVTLHRGLQLVLSKQLELVTLNIIFSLVHYILYLMSCDVLCYCGNFSNDISYE